MFEENFIEDTVPVEFRRKIESIKDLPTLPLVSQKLLKLLNDPDSSVLEVAQVIKTDPALTTKVLKLVNSAYYGLRNPISTVSRAVTYLGYREVKNLIITVSVFKILKEAKTVLFDKVLLWQHMIGVAVASRYLFLRSSYTSSIDIEEVFTAGLLHDIGKIVFELLWPSKYREVFELVDNYNLTMDEAESKIFSFSHSLVGAHLLKMWKIPQIILSTVKYHHKPLEAKASFFPLAAIVNAADVFCRLKKIGSGGGNFIPSLDRNIAMFLELKVDEFEPLIEAIREEVDKASEFLNLMQNE